MPDVRACPACLATRSRSAGVVAGFDMRRCRSCGTLFTALLPQPDESLDYDDYYHEGNLEVPAFVTSRLDEIVGRFAGDRVTGRWLDVGCGAGTLLEAARRAGWEAVGTEVSKRAVEAVRERGFEVHQGDLRELALEPGTFDVVSLVEVLEHVADPREQLARAGALVRAGGVVYVTTPHGRGVSARLLRTRWSVVAPPEHVQLFSLGGLRRAADDAGLALRSVRTRAVNPAELLAALRPGRAKLGGNARVETGYRLNEALTSTSGGTAVKRVANAVLGATRLGDTIHVVAERRP